MADLQYDVGVSVDNALSGLDKFQKKIKQVNDDFEKFSSTINNVATGLAAALSGLAASAAHFADEMADVAAANETSIASVLGLASALQGAGGNADSVGRLFQTLSGNIDSANTGNLKMVATFQKMGISLEELGTKSSESIRNDLIKALADITDPAERAAKAQELFGKAALGVDWKKVAADIDENTQKYSQYESQLQLAADAFDSVSAAIKDIKIAAAVAFEPLFRYLKDLKVDIPTVTAVIKLMAAALAAAVSVSVLAGFAKLLVILKDINTVVSKNKLITIIGALVAIGSAAATWMGMTKDVEDAQDGVNQKVDETQQKTDKVKRDQSGINDVIKKQIDSLTQVRENYDRQIQNLKDKVKFEADSLYYSEEQKKIAEQQNNIEQQTQNALLSLKQKFDALDVNSRAARQADYDKELKKIEENGAAAKKAVEDQISVQYQLKGVMSDVAARNQMVGEAQTQMLKDIVGLLNETAGYKQQIELNQRLNDLISVRSLLFKNLNNVAESQRASVVNIIDETTTGLTAINSSNAEIVKKLEEQIQLNLDNGKITTETANQMTRGIYEQMKAVGEIGAVMQVHSEKMAEQRRSWSQGWNKSFRDYIEDATNGAKVAENIFKKAMSGMEDALVNFAKTGKFEWKNFVNMMLEELLRSQIRSVMAQLFSANSSSVKGGGSFLGGLLGFASGGIIPTNAPVLVGERGPEIIAGASGRQVIPNNELGGNSTINYNISAVDARSFKELIASDPSFIHAIAMQGAKGIPSRR